jgi:hypothetical protein
MAHGAIIRVTASDASMIFNHQACKEMAALSLERPNLQTNNRCRGSPPPLCERSSLLSSKSAHLIMLPVKLKCLIFPGKQRKVKLYKTSRSLWQIQLQFI